MQSVYFVLVSLEHFVFSFTTILSITANIQQAECELTTLVNLPRSLGRFTRYVRLLAAKAASHNSEAIVRLTKRFSLLRLEEYEVRVFRFRAHKGSEGTRNRMSDLKAEGLIRNAFKRSLKRFTSILSCVVTTCL